MKYKRFLSLRLESSFPKIYEIFSELLLNNESKHKMSALYGIIVKKQKCLRRIHYLFKNKLSLLLEASSNWTYFYRDENKYKNYNKLTWLSNNDIIMNVNKCQNS